MKSLRIALSVLVCVIALSAVGLAQNVGPGPGVYPATGGSSGVATVTGTSPIASSGGAHPAISLSGVTAEQGNGTKVQLSTGSTTTNDCVKFDANGNTIDNGSGCGGQPIYTQTITESTGAATMTVHSSSVANIDVDYLALNAAATITTPAAASMADGEQIYLDASTSGGAFTTGFTAGAGTSLATIVLGDGTPFATPAACGAVPATGHSWTRWQYRTSNTTLTLLGCGVNPPPSALGVALGGTSLTTLTNHALQVGAGTAAVTQVGPSATTGQVATSQGASSDPAFLSRPYDIGFSISGTPSASQVIPFIATRTINLPASLTGSYPDAASQASCGTNPSESDAYLLKVVGSTVCTLTLNTSCALAVTTCTGTTAITAGQRVELDAPGTVSGANIAIVIAGHTP